jgi:hypothetical protein
MARVLLLLGLFTCGATLAAGPLEWLGSTEIASGRAERGPWQQNESRYDYVDDPSVAIDERGEMVAVWVHQKAKDVFLQCFSAGGKALGSPVNVSRSPSTFSWLPRVVLAAGEPRQVFVLWQEIVFSGGSHGGEIFFARSQDGGATFSEPLNLSRSIAGDGKGRINRDVWHNGSLDLAAGGDGALYAAWTEYEGVLWLSVSGDGGESFSAPRRIAGDNAHPARAPSLAVGADRAVYVAWTLGEDDGADIHIARSTDGGAAFSEPRIVARSPGYSDAPKLAADRRGALHLAYAESSGGPFERYHVRYTRSSDGARSFEPPRRISPPGAAFPSLGVDGKGGVYVLWERQAHASQRPRGLGFTVSRDEGGSFSPGVVVAQSADPGGGWNGSFQGLLMKKLAVNAEGTVAIVNSSLKDNERSRVWMMRAAAR